MPRVLPFAGVRYAAQRVPDLAAAVCPPYDVISPAEQRALQAQSPYNAVFLEFPQDAPESPGSRYARAAAQFQAWQAEGVLTPDPRPAYYLHETEFTWAGQAHRRRDLIAALGVEPWATGAVLPHEHTMAGPKADRLALLRATHANLSPLWILYRAEPLAVAAAWQTAAATAPTLELEVDCERHRLWRVDDPATVAAIQAAYAAGGALYIADGHHRYETALAFSQEPDAPAGADAALAVFTWADDPGMQVLPTHRMLAGAPAGTTLASLEAQWQPHFDVVQRVPLAHATGATVEAGLAMAAAGHTRIAVAARDGVAVFALRDPAAADGALPRERSTAWRALDVARLHELMLDPLLARIDRPRNDVLTFTRDADEALQAVRSGAADFAFFLNATRVTQVLDVADAQDRMPEKSTYFFPKAPTGLVIRGLA